MRRLRRRVFPCPAAEALRLAEAELARVTAVLATEESGWREALGASPFAADEERLARATLEFPEGTPLPDTEAAEAAADAAVGTASGEAGRLAEAARTNAALVRSRQEDAAETARIGLELQAAQELRDVTSGNNQNARFPLSLEEYMLRAHFDGILVQAGRRLQFLGRTRYNLVRADRARGNATVGLELEVEDLWNGQRRPASTLSGGEGFLASLALALGLGNVVQAIRPAACGWTCSSSTKASAASTNKPSRKTCAC